MEQGLPLGRSGARPGTNDAEPKPAWLYQVRALLPTLIVTYTAAVGLLIAILIVRLQTDIHFSYFTRDPSAIAGERAYIGLVSNLGILLWSAAAAMCFFGFTVLRRRNANERELSSYLLLSGLFTSLLLLDDLFLFHESIGRSLGVSDSLVLVAYGIVGSLYLIRFAHVVLGTEFLPLLLALGFLGMSAIVDAIPANYTGQPLLEEGPKLLGIVSWAVYFMRVSLQGTDRAYGRSTWQSSPPR